MNGVFKRTRNRIETLAGGQVAVLVVVGLILTRMFWNWGDDAQRAAIIASFGTAFTQEVRTYTDKADFYKALSFVVAIATVLLAFTWFGRKRND
ncbi:MAG: hypothetical protein M3Z54_15100 [Gemmatimonadota bacterium]|nr:hypothetical protein [Gemmatimonadota bacterium]